MTRQDPVIRVEPIILDGHGVRLEPLSVEHHDALEAAAADGRLWELWYTRVRELSGGRVIGSTSYHDIVAAIDRVEIGAISKPSSFATCRHDDAVTAPGGRL